VRSSCDLKPCSTCWRVYHSMYERSSLSLLSDDYVLVHTNVNVDLDIELLFFGLIDNAEKKVNLACGSNQLLQFVFWLY
jgi:hypothetical protein